MHITMYLQTVRVVEVEDEYAYGQFAGHSNLIREKQPTDKTKKKGLSTFELIVQLFEFYTICQT